MKKLLILGSTGSIGRNVIDIVKKNKDLFSVIGISARDNVKLLIEQIRELMPRFVAIENEDYGREIKRMFPSISVIYGEHSSSRLIEDVDDVDLVVNAIIGFDGFLPTIKALNRGFVIALANKESLVVGGDYIRERFFDGRMDIYHTYRIIPIDSEHNAIFSILSRIKREGIRKIYLTASGGPFLGYSKDKLNRITPDDALNHPVWKMGKKITIDSATMMNKGFEVIEAHYLFGVAYDNIKVIIHPNGLVHGMVLFRNGEFMLNAYKPDMRIPIANAIFFPNEVNGNWVMDFDALSLMNLDIREVNIEEYKALKICYEVGRLGGGYLVALNAVNEEAVYSFLREEIRFLDILDIINEVLDSLDIGEFQLTVEGIIYFDRLLREKAKEVIRRRRCKM